MLPKPNKPGKQLQLPPLKKPKRIELPTVKPAAATPAPLRPDNRAACHQLWLEATVECSRLISKLTTLCGSELPADDIERIGACTLPVLALFRKASKRLIAVSLEQPNGRRLVKLESPSLLINACLRCLFFKAGLLADANGLCEAAERAGEAEALKFLQRARELARLGLVDYLSYVVREYPAITSNPEFAARKDWLELLKTAKAK